MSAKVVVNEITLKEVTIEDCSPDRVYILIGRQVEGLYKLNQCGETSWYWVAMRNSLNWLDDPRPFREAIVRQMDRYTIIQFDNELEFYKWAAKCDGDYKI